MRFLFSFFFGCFHERTTFPITIRNRTYVCCLNCGTEIPYFWDTMTTGEPEVARIVAEEMGR